MASERRSIGRHFGGLTEEETATALKVSPETVRRDWRIARSWLRRQLSGEPQA
jgi:RNA polymerase sigma-70 factor, ECF subfamily